MKSSNVDDETMAVDRVHFFFERGANKKKKENTAPAFIIHQTPLCSLQCYSCLSNWMGSCQRCKCFHGWRSLWNIVERSPHSFAVGDTHTGPERGLRLQFDNTENDGIAVWLKQSRPLLMSVTHGASGLQLAHKWVLTPLIRRLFAQFCLEIAFQGSGHRWLGDSLIWVLKWATLSAYWVRVNQWEYGIKVTCVKSRAPCFPSLRKKGFNVTRADRQTYWESSFDVSSVKNR